MYLICAGRNKGLLFCAILSNSSTDIPQSFTMSIVTGIRAILSLLWHKSVL